MYFCSMLIGDVLAKKWLCWKCNVTNSANIYDLFLYAVSIPPPVYFQTTYNFGGLCSKYGHVKFVCPCLVMIVFQMCYYKK